MNRDRSRPKKLPVVRLTVRELTPADLDQVVGGRQASRPPGSTIPDCA